MTKFVLYRLAEIDNKVEHIVIDTFDANNVDDAADYFRANIEGDLDEAFDTVGNQSYFTIDDTSYIVCPIGELPIHD